MTTASLFQLNAGVIGSETPDEELVQRILAGATHKLEVLMHRHARRLYRTCRAVVANDAEAEEALQAAFLRAYRLLGQFRGDAEFAPWLTRIAIHESLARLRLSSTDPRGKEPRIAMRPQLVSTRRDSGGELTNQGHILLMEEAIDALPSNYRTVFVLRHLEELNVDETAACLLLGRETVETRLLHARRILETRLRPHVLNQPVEQVLPFRDARCIGLIGRVMKTIA